MRSDTEGEGASESDTQKETIVQTAQKKTDRMPRPGGVVEGQSSDQEELRKLQNTTFTDTGR